MPTTHYLESSPILSGCSGDVHRRSHSFLLIHPREVILAWCWMITRPSSCGIVLLSLPRSRLNWGLLSHTWQTPMHKGMPALDAMRRSLLQCRMGECLCWSFTSYKGISGVIWHTTLWGLSSHLSLILLFPWKASDLTKQGLQASNLHHLFSSCSTVFVSEPLP